MSKSRRSRDAEWNPSHQTRFSSEHQPQRRRGAGKVKIDRNMIRMVADALADQTTVTNPMGERVKMSQANYLVQKMFEKARKGGLDDLFKLFDRFAKWGLLGDLEIEGDLLVELNRQLDAAKQEIKFLRGKLERSTIVADLLVEEAVTLLVTADTVLDEKDTADPGEIVSLRRDILELQLLLEDARRSGQGSPSPGWNGADTADEWLAQLLEEEAEQERVRNERLAEFDRQHPTHNREQRSNPDEDDFFPDLTSED